MGNQADLAVRHMEEQRLWLPEECFGFPPKIARGERYRDLPWVMLDIPRYFGKNDQLAIRHFFWWGNFFASSLQVAGKFKDKLVQNILGKRVAADCFICVQASPWDHHFDEGNYEAMSGMEPQRLAVILDSQPFIKLAKVLPIQHWEKAAGFFENCFVEWTTVLREKGDQLPRR